MPSHPPARLTKKQRKATAFRERGIKSKGTGKQNPTPAPGRPRLGRRHSPSTGDNGEGHHDDEDEEDADEDANAVPAMEEQDQAMAEVDSAAAQKKKGKGKDKDKKKRSRADDGEAPPASKKARLSRSSDKSPVPLAHEEDKDEIGATRMNTQLKDGESGEHESETKDKRGSKQQRYILFIGMSLSPPPPSLVTHSSKGTSSTPRRARQSRAISPSAVRSHPVLRILCHQLTRDPHPTYVLPAHDRPASDRALTHSQAHPSWCDGDQVQRLCVPRVLGAVSVAGCPPHAPV